MKAFPSQLVAAALICIPSLAAYEYFIARPARAIHVVDSLAVFRLEEQRLATMMVGEPSQEQRERIVAQARAFSNAFPQALEALSDDCSCVVIERSAVVGASKRIIDLTPDLRRRMQL